MGTLCCGDNRDILLRHLKDQSVDLVDHEHGGFTRALTAGFQPAEIHHVRINTIYLTGAPFGYNALSVIRRHLGAGELIRLCLQSALAPAQVGKRARGAGGKHEPDKATETKTHS